MERHRSGATPHRDRPRVRLLGVELDPLTMDETVEAIAAGIASGLPGAHLGVNAANLVAAQDDRDYASDLAEADLVTADGQSMVWTGRLLGLEIPERVTGIDLMERLIREAPSRSWRVFLLGAQEDVVAAVARRLARKGVDVVGTRDGYFADAMSDEVAREIADRQPDLLFVGMPSSRKERFIVRHARPAGIRYSVGVGGSFEVIAGRKRRAPAALQRAGLEWTVRLAQEPRRLARRYTVTNLQFARLVLAELGRRRRRS